MNNCWPGKASIKPINIEIGSLTHVGSHKTLIYSPYANNIAGINIFGIAYQLFTPFFFFSNISKGSVNKTDW